jgi:hypothetical protein
VSYGDDGRPASEPESGGWALATLSYLIDSVRNDEAFGSLSTHPAGKQPSVEVLSEGVGLRADTFGGRVHVE